MVRGQLSIDYVIVFSFVLVIFVLIFGIVATQRVQTSQQQDYAQLQVIAQTIAQDMNIAASSGSGYAQNVSLPAGPGLVSYNLSITSSGTVIVYDNSTGRLAYAYAYAPVGRIISSQSYVNANSPNTYVLPVATGLIYLQNSHGDLCIDYFCNTTSVQTSGLRVYTKLTHAAQMNGQSSYIYVPNSISLLEPFNTNAVTMSAWVYVNKFPIGASENPVVNYGTSQTGSYCFGPRIYVSANSIHGGFQKTNQGSSDASLPIKNNTWYFVAFTYSSSTNQLTLYVNGMKTVVDAVVPLDSPSDIYNLVLGSSSYTYNGGQSSCDGSSPLNGSVSDVQIYSNALTANQVYQLENSGINGGPVQTYDLSGWWPLNGNANDYSGNSNNGRASAVVYPAVAQIYANVTNATLAPVKDDLVGFSSTLGKFQDNNRSASNFTNSNGIASAFLTQGTSTGYATLKVTPFEGNVNTARYLSGWWPLNANQGNVIYNLANNSASGTLANGYWNNVNYVGSFSGDGSYVSVPNSANTDIYTEPLTLSFWMNPSQTSPNKLESIIFKPKAYAICIANGAAMDFEYGTLVKTIPLNGGYGYGYNLSANKWYNVVISLNGAGGLYAYVNGKQVGYVGGITGNWNNSASSNNLVIGGNVSSSFESCPLPGYSVSPFDGKLSNIQIYSGNLTAQQINILYSEGIAGAPVANMNAGTSIQGWWPLNGNTNDYSGNGDNGFGMNGFTFTRYTAQTVANNPDTYLATYFNGQNSYMSVNTVNNYLLGTTDSFTLTAWIYSNGTCSQNPDQVVAGDLGTNSGFRLHACYSSGRAGSTSLLNVAGSSIQAAAFPTNSWEMVTAEYNGSTGTTTMYLNNRLAASGTLSSGLNLAQTVPFEIGNSQASGQTEGFNGSLADVQLYSKTLSGSDINNLYKSGVYGMPRPNYGLVGWWPLNGNANDYSGNNNSGTEYNTTYEYLVNPSLIPGLGGYGISSLNSGDAAIVAPHNYPTFSIAAWAYLDQPVPGSGTYLGTTGSTAYSLFRNATSTGFRVGAGSAYSNNLTAFPTGKWTYVVGTYDGSGVINYYVDGRLFASGSATATVSPGNLIIGSNLAGSIANVEYYSTALTAGQVYQLYNNQMPVTYTEQIPLSWGT